MERRVIKVACPRHLYDLAQIHHGDVRADVLHYGKVVGNENVSQTEFLLQVLQEIDDLCLNGYVERGYRLVTDNQLGRNRQGASNSDALALSARELMWISPHMIRVEPHGFEQLDDSVHELPMGLHQTVNDQRLAYDRTDCHARIERGIRILKNDLHVAAQSPQLRSVERCDVRTLKPHLARGRLSQAQDT